MATAFASDAGHWYLQDGTPYYEVPNKSSRRKCESCGDSPKSDCAACSGTGYTFTMRGTTLRDARLADACPSVTGIIRAMAASGLVAWEKQQLKEAIYTAPRGELDGLEYADWSAKVEEWATQHKREAAQVGTDIHATIEKGFRGQSLSDDPYRAWYTAAWQELASAIGSFVAHPERSFACAHGYGCKVDLIADCPARLPVVVDYKTKDFKTGKDGVLLTPEVTDDHAMQVAANGVCAGYRLGEFDGGILFVDRKNPVARYVGIDQDTLARGWRMFLCCLRLTRERSGYRPTWAQDAF